jgi:hypothetical protein
VLLDGRLGDLSLQCLDIGGDGSILTSPPIRWRSTQPKNCSSAR